MSAAGLGQMQSEVPHTNHLLLALTRKEIFSKIYLERGCALLITGVTSKPLESLTTLVSLEWHTLNGLC
jgi:hypothetical protein